MPQHLDWLQPWHVGTVHDLLVFSTNDRVIRDLCFILLSTLSTIKLMYLLLGTAMFMVQRRHLPRLLLAVAA